MHSLGIIIPFLNEEVSLDDVVKSLRKKLIENKINYKILLVDDGSTDQSSVIAQNLYHLDPNIILIRNPTPLNIGNAYKEGLKTLNTQFICWLPSDGEIPPETIIKCYNSTLDNDKPSISYPINGKAVRPFFRYFLSKIFQGCCRKMFDIDIIYFNAIGVYPLSMLQGLNLISEGFTINLEIIVKFKEKFQVNFNQIPFALEPRNGGKEKALKMKNIYNVIKTLIDLRRSI